LLFTALAFVIGLLVGPSVPVRDGLMRILGKRYTATSLVHVRPNLKSLLDGKLPAEIEDKPFQRSQETLLKSMTVIQYALEEPKIAALRTIRDHGDAALWLQDELKIDFTGEIMRISLSGERKNDLVPIVNAITDSYLRTIGNLDRLHVRVDIETLTELQKKYVEQLENKRSILTALTRVIGSNDQEALTLKGRLILQQEADLIKELVWAGTERQKAQIEYDLKRGQAQEYFAKPSPEELANLGQKLAFYTQYVRILKEQVDKQSAEPRNTDETKTRILALQDEIHRIEQVHDRIGSRLEQLKVDEENKSPRIELIERASIAK
jgi:hypothetical protein